MVDGLLYEIDITAEPGSKIINLMNEDGSAFDLAATYTVALNSYRYNGGGGHMGAIGAVADGVVTANTVYSSDKAMRDLMIEFLKVTGEWGPDEKDDNWRLVPLDLAEEAINMQLGVGTSAR